MEFAINVAYTNGEVDFKSAALKKETTNLFKEMGKSKKSFCAAAKSLQKIRDEELFNEDFLDANGKPSFAEYCAQVLNISKTKAYDIIKTANTLLFPELVTKEKDEYFTQFNETNLNVLASVGDYDAVKTFCEENNIDESTSLAEVRKIVRGSKNEKNCDEGDGNGEQITMDDKATRTSAKQDLITLVNILNTYGTKLFSGNVLTDEETTIVFDIIKKYSD